MGTFNKAQEFEFLAKSSKLDFVKEYRFDYRRKWRFDFALPKHRIAVEIEGGTWKYGRHNRPDGYRKDCEKYNAAVFGGWKVFRITADMSGTDLIQRIENYIMT